MEEQRHDIDETICQPHLNGDERLIAELVRMGKQRHIEPCPEPQTEWEQIESKLQDSEFEQAEESDRQRMSATIRRLKIWAVAATSVAAALISVLICTTFLNINDRSQYVALDYEESSDPVYIKQEDGQTVSLAGKDSIDFRKSTHYYNNKGGKKQQLTTPRGMDFKVILPDGTEVLLNAESTIKFPTSFLQGEQRIELEGEAFFKVAHNAHKPFTVDTRRMSVRVLGTEFNLRCYETGAPHVSLVSGSVEVLKAGEAVSECRLVPGQDAWRDADGALHVAQIDTYGVTQWTEGFFYFDDTTLHDILCELGRWYNLGVVFKQTAAMNIKLHFSASRKAGINEALSAINSMLNVSVKVEGTDIVVM